MKKIEGTAVKRPVEIKYRIARKKQVIKTLEGNMTARKGDYIITGVNGEQYPCQADIFLRTYIVKGKKNENKKY